MGKHLLDKKGIDGKVTRLLLENSESVVLALQFLTHVDLLLPSLLSLL